MRPVSNASKKALFIKLVGMGDVVLSLPTIAAFRKAFPEHQIHYLTGIEGLGVVSACSLIDNVVPVNHFRSIVSRLPLALYSAHYDICVDLEQFARISAIFSRFTHARSRIGFACDGQNRHMGTTAAVPFDSTVHVVQNFARLLEPIGIHARPTHLIPLDTSQQEIEWARSFGVSVAIHPGTGDTCIGRRWPLDRCARLIEWLISRYDFSVCLTGSRSERPLCRDLYDSIEGPAKEKVIDLSGKTTVRQLAAIYSAVRLMVSNDTGPMHLAAAQGAKVIGLFGPQLPTRYAPFCSRAEAIYRGAGCSPCIDIEHGIVPDCRNMNRDHPNVGSVCMAAISLDDVQCGVQRLLN